MRGAEGIEHGCEPFTLAESRPSLIGDLLATGWVVSCRYVGGCG